MDSSTVKEEPSSPMSWLEEEEEVGDKLWRIKVEPDQDHEYDSMDKQGSGRSLSKRTSVRRSTRIRKSRNASIQFVCKQSEFSEEEEDDLSNHDELEEKKAAGNKPRSVQSSLKKKTEQKPTHKPLDYCELSETDGNISYKCVKCQKQFSSRDPFVRHLNREHEIYFVEKRKAKVLSRPDVEGELSCYHKGECPERGRKFASFYALENHNRLFHQNLNTTSRTPKEGFDYLQLVSKLGPLRQWKCRNCKAWFQFEEERTQHEEGQHHQFEESSIWNCKSCYSSYTNKNDLVIHLEQQHKGEGLEDLPGRGKDIHLCPECPAKFFSPHGLEFHIALIHGKLQNPKRRRVLSVCTICGYGIKSAAVISTHMRQHTGNRPYMCDICGDTFTEEKYLQSHAALKHDEVPESLSSTAAVEEFIQKHKCPTCEKTFSQPAALRVHIKTQHEGQYRYRCPICNLGVEFQNGLKRHMLTHENNEKKKPHKCPHTDCGASFRSAADVTRHVKTKHTQDRPFPCNELGCKKAFVTEKDRERHIKAAHSKEVKFTCDLCGKGFPVLDYYRGHMRRMHNTNQAPNKSPD